MTVFSDVAGFLIAALEREGAAVEVMAPGRIDAVLPPPLQSDLGLPESVSLLTGGTCAPSEISAAIESQLMQRLVDRVTARGRIAGCTLAGARNPASVGGRVVAQVQGLNATVRLASTRTVDFQAMVLEFPYSAAAEERSEGVIEVATDVEFGSVSAALAAALLDRLPECAPSPVRLDPSAVANAIGRVDAVVRALAEDRLGPFRARLSARLGRDAARVVSYHDTLLSEAAGRRGRSDAAAAASKAAAVLRSRDEKLADLVARYGVTVRYGNPAILLVSYSSCACDLIIRRRQREIPISILWDPVLHAPLPVSCPGCTLPTLSFHACDDAGHLTCPSCAAPCATCSRVSCRACHPPGCPRCRSAGDGGGPPVSAGRSAGGFAGRSAADDGVAVTDAQAWASAKRRPAFRDDAAPSPPP